MSNIVLECNDLTRSFKDGAREVTVLNKVNLQVQAGESIAITGASGAGKSTFLHLLGGLDKPTSGSVSVLGSDLSRMSEAKKSKLRNKNLGFVYQFHHLLPEFNTLENVMLPLQLQKISDREAKARATDLLVKVGLGDHLTQNVTNLSGGERQRVAIARALVANPACVLADEPTGNLDQKNSAAVFDLLLDLQSSLNAALVVVTHDPVLAARLDRQLEL
jgi:lipoprotein-releasing system ATP-binding protein